MLKLFDLVAKKREDIEKVALLGAAARMFSRVGKSAFKNPMKTVGAVGSGYELNQGFKKGTNLATATKDMAKVQSKMIPKTNQQF